MTYGVMPPPDRLAETVQVMTAFSTERGELIRFVVQLEYWLNGDWRTVVRYDHDAIAPGGHDVATEGLHRDVYRHGEKVRVEALVGPIPATKAFDYAEEDLNEYAEQYIKRFERWHGVKDRANL